MGSGTGKLSAQLLAAGFRVCGVEPNRDMRSAAESLLGGDPRFTSPNGTDRDTGLPDRSVDFVTAAQAFHWFDGGAFARECRRILRPGGQVYLIWNIRTDAPINQALAGLFREHCPSFGASAAGWQKMIPASGHFSADAYEKRRFPNPLTLDRDRFLRRCFSSSYALREGDADYEAYRAALEALFDTFAPTGN